MESRPGPRSSPTSVLDEVEQAVVGKREPLELVFLGFLADGHVLLEDYPGLAKTLAARSFAQVLGIDFARIQFTPDLMPSDVTGSSIWNQRDADFEFRPGPIFTNLLLADEINRAPPKTQAALLEAMQERQATIEGVTHPSRRRRSSSSPPRTRSSTRAPTRFPRRSSTASSCERRSAIRAARDEVDVLARRIERAADDVVLRTVIDRETLLEMQRAVETVHVADSVREYCVDLVAATRDVAERRGRREPAREPRPAQARPLPGRAAGARLRPPGRREGDHRPGARAPARPPPRALGAADHAPRTSSERCSRASRRRPAEDVRPAARS